MNKSEILRAVFTILKTSYIFFIPMLGMVSTSAQAITDSDVASNIGKVAAVHTVLMKDYNGLPQLVLTQSASRNLTAYLKDNIDKRRPDGSNLDSFPSGHAARSFSAAWYIHHRYGIKHSWPYLAASTWVSQQRVEKERHAVEDVAASMFLTYGVSKLFTSKQGEAPIIGVWYDDGPHLSIIKRF